MTYTPGAWYKGRDGMTTLDDVHGWKKYIYVEDPRGGIHKPTGEPLPFVVGCGYGETQEEAHANARMMAAAPEMLDALKDTASRIALQLHLHDDAEIEKSPLLSRDRDVLLRIKRAIRAAEGGGE